MKNNEKLLTSFNYFKIGCEWFFFQSSFCQLKLYFCLVDFSTKQPMFGNAENSNI